MEIIFKDDQQLNAHKGLWISNDMHEGFQTLKQ